MSLLASGVLANPTTPYFSQGSGPTPPSGAVILNNASSSSPSGSTLTLVPNTPTLITSVTITANYASGALSVMPLVLTQVPELYIENAATASILPADKLVIFVDVSIGTGTPEVLTPTQTFAPPPAVGNTVQCQFNAIGPAAVNITQASYTYTVRLMARYETLGTTNAVFTLTPYDFYAQVLGCVTSA